MLGTRFTGALALAAIASAFVAPAAAAPVTDCPLRDAPFSTASPLIDILLNPQAKGVVEREIPGGLSKMPPIFIGTEPPTFAAILTPLEAGRFIRIAQEKLVAIDAELRALPVTDADKVAQREAFESYLERGGAFVGVHGTAGDPVYFWDWYADTLIGARFAGHPMAPQFQDARIVIEGKSHPIARQLPAEWVMNDE